MIRAEQQAAEEMLLQTRKMVDEQVRIWSEALEGMRKNWVESLHSQESQLHQAISKSLEHALESWQSELKAEAGTLTSHQAEMRKQTELLTQLIDREESLSSVSEKLNQNLAAITGLPMRMMSF